MRCLVFLSLLLVAPAAYGQATKTRRGPRPPNYRPPPLPSARQHPAVLTKQNVVPPPAGRGRNDVKDVPDNFQAGPPPAPAPVPPPAPGYIPPAAPASRRRPPVYRTFQAPPPAANVPPTRTRSVGLLRPLPPQPMYMHDPYVPPVTPPTTQAYDWGAHHDVNKEEEESR